MFVEYEFLKIASMDSLIKREAIMNEHQINRINNDLEAINNQLALLEVNDEDKKFLIDLYNMLVKDIENAIKDE